MEENFDKILREKLRNFEKSPPPGTFAAIQQKLKEPETKERKLFVLPMFVKYGIAASFAFLLGLLAMNWFSDFNDPNNNSNTAVAIADTPSIENDEVANNNLTIIDKIGEGINEAGINSIESASTNLLNEIIETPMAKIQVRPDHKKTRPNVFTDNTGTLASNNSNTNSSVSTSGVNGIYSNEEYLNEYLDYNTDGGKVVIDIKSKYASMYKPKTDNISTYALFNIENEIEDGVEVVKVEDAYPNSTYRGNNKKKKTGYQGFWFGPRISYEAEAISAYTLSGVGLGMDVGYDVSPKFGFQSGIRYDILLKNVEYEGVDGNLYSDNLNLSSINVPFGVKYKKSYFASKMERPVSFNTYLGMDYARLTALKKNQLGAHVGVEYDIFLKPEMMITMGLRAGFGSILDYNPSQEYLKANYRKLNYSFGLYTALRFIQPSRKG